MNFINKESDANLGKRVTGAGMTTIAAGLDALAGGIPAFSAVWLFSQASIGNAMALRQKRVYEWVEMIKDNPQIFREELLTSIEFQDAFVVSLEDYLKIREVLKRGMAKKIFKNFAESEDIDNYELERFNMSLRQISVGSIKFLGYLKENIEPVQHRQISEIVSTVDLDNSPINVIKVRQLVSAQVPLSKVYQELMPQDGNQIMLPNKPDPLHPTIQGSMGVTELSETMLNNEQHINELVSLGILRRSQYSTTGGGYDSQPIYHDFWNYTSYGKKFSELLGEE